MYSTKGNSTHELWAVVYKDGSIAFSRGGSSSTPRLMVYATKGKAEGALKSPWIKQIINTDEVTVKRIYQVPEGK